MHRLLILLTLAGSALAVDGALEIDQTCAVQAGRFAGIRRVPDDDRCVEELTPAQP